MTLSLLNLDSSYPVADSHHSTNTSGVIRWINVADANAIAAMQRYMGDAFHRSRLIEAKINSIIQAFNSNPYTSGFDDTVYVKTDGSHPLTSPLSSPSPSSSLHLVNKAYADAAVASLQSSIQTLDSRVTALQTTIPLVRVSDWQEYEWSAGEKTHLTFTLSPARSEVSDIASISLIERLNKGTEDEPNYVYMQYSAGNSTNFKVDAMWVDDADSNTLHVLLPNDVNYPDGYPSSSGYGDLQSFQQRHLKAIVVHAIGAC